MIQQAPRIEYFPAPDGYRLATRIWQVAEPAGRVVVVHGIVSHGGWYLQTCRYLARCGFEVHAPDRRGSGLNLASRGDVDRYPTWLSDVESYLEQLSDPLPTVLLGISWGGKFVAALARHRPELVAGVGMICPGLFARQQPNGWQRLALRAAGLCGLGRLRIDIPLQDPALFTDAPPWRAYIRDDPLTLWRITIRFALADHRCNRYVREAPDAIRLPVLLMLTGRDRITDNRRTREYFDRVASPDKTLIEYPDAAHTLEFEADASEYLRDVEHWVHRVTTARPSRRESCAIPK
jgi:alpha-beta hydrolase superfamily lysophospholipase